MGYVENRIVHDADSHLMELPDSLDAYFDPKYRAAYDALRQAPEESARCGLGEEGQAQQDDANFRDGADANASCCANYEAHGAFRRETGRARSTTWASRAS